MVQDAGGGLFPRTQRAVGAGGPEVVSRELEAGVGGAPAGVEGAQLRVAAGRADDESGVLAADVAGQDGLAEAREDGGGRGDGPFGDGAVVGVPPAVGELLPGVEGDEPAAAVDPAGDLVVVEFDADQRGVRPLGEEEREGLFRWRAFEAEGNDQGSRVGEEEER
ncbi:hypothetical protein SMICM17S_02175 [Streptomyces microflavus]